MIDINTLKIGDSMQHITLSPVSYSDLVKYAQASGDFNPIHLKEKEAKIVGLPNIIAHGMWTMGNLAKLFTPYLTKNWFIQDYDIRFTNMVFIEDVITLHAILLKKEEDELKFNVFAKNQQGIDVIKGSVVIKQLCNYM